jgi:hypothetical protein
MVWLNVYAIMIFRYDLIILDVGTLERIVTSSTVRGSSGDWSQNMNIDTLGTSARYQLRRQPRQSRRCPALRSSHPHYRFRSDPDVEASLMACTRAEG